LKKLALTAVVAVAAALVLVHVAQRQLATLWPALGVHPQVAAALERSMADQKELARLDPERSRQYRARFEEVQSLRNRLLILRLSQDEIAHTQERILFGVVAFTIVAGAVIYLLRQRREQRRLGRIEHYVERLSSGEQHLRIGERGDDAIAKIAGMIERTSDVVAAERQRLRYLENLASWQEAARRHAHEIRTPLTAAQMEMERLCTEAAAGWPAGRELIAERRSSIAEELERLRQFTRSFTSFAAIGVPQRVRTDLAAFLHELAETYAAAWTLSLRVGVDGPGCFVDIDRGMLRQVLVNLCTNSALAGSTEVAIRTGRTDRYAFIDIADNGKGIEADVSARLFQPYVTTRPPGEGMGLGLSISRKILLDHGGDLQLKSTGRDGTTFRATLPCAEELAS
jgi:two-component system nitrogen regulation sensor histidine kinase NtrY